MFFWIGFLFFALGWIPLAITVSRKETQTAQQFRKGVKRGFIALLIDSVILIAVNTFLHFYTELLWFRTLGFQGRFWTILTSEVVLFGIGTTVAFIVLEVNRRIAGMTKQKLAGGGVIVVLGLVVAAFLGLRAGALWRPALLFFNQTASPVTDPIFNKPENFYLFSLPFLVALQQWVLMLVFVTGIFTLGTYVSSVRFAQGTFDMDQFLLKRSTSLYRHLLVLAGLLLVVFAWKFYLDLFKLLYSSRGAVTGAGYVDARFRTLGLYVTIAMLGAGAVVVFVSAFSQKFGKALLGIHSAQGERVGVSARSIFVPAGAVFVFAVFNGFIPWLVTATVVNPNEITVERPYIKHNIEFTRRAYGLSGKNVTKQQHDVGRNISKEVVRRNEPTLQNVRLWDWRALMDNLKERQEIRLYYEFNDVDIDRYHLGTGYRQVMLSVREMEKENLDPRSKTWVSEQLKYTHGYGMVFLPVNEFLAQGGPRFLIHNIPPAINEPNLSLSRPEVYYGERTRDHVYVKTSEQEFDYPSGEENVYANYSGTGGVTMGTLLRRIAFAWKFDGHRILFSDYFGNDSRVMFHRHIVERAKTIAPFLVYDNDPYAVLGDDGKMYYMLDAYTVSGSYPYSERYRGGLSYLNGINYIRNSVKVVVDAYNGSVDFYAIDTNDIILKTYTKIFAQVFRPLDQMPETLRRHIRYPADLLTIQARMYATYHMEEPDVFYQREDAWEFATERYRENFQEVEPYYVLMRFPGSEKPEFVLMMPFTPRNKNVMNAWVAGRCDEPNYGELIVFTFPKGVDVLGPRQIEARIDQDAEMSKAMTLWGQGGSEVLRGNLLAIPLFTENTMHMLYVEPIFLQADNANLPEIKRVVLADQERIVWAETFDDALALLSGERVFGGTTSTLPLIGSAETASPARDQTIELIGRHLRRYKTQTGQGNYSAAGSELDVIDSLLGSTIR